MRQKTRRSVRGCLFIVRCWVSLHGPDWRDGKLKVITNHLGWTRFSFIPCFLCPTSKDALPKALVTPWLDHTPQFRWISLHFVFPKPDVQLRSRYLLLLFLSQEQLGPKNGSEGSPHISLTGVRSDLLAKSGSVYPNRNIDVMLLFHSVWNCFIITLRIRETFLLIKQSR